MFADSTLVEVRHEGASVSFESTFDSFDSAVLAVPDFVTGNYNKCEISKGAKTDLK